MTVSVQMATTSFAFFFHIIWLVYRAHRYILAIFAHPPYPAPYHTIQTLIHSFIRSFMSARTHAQLIAGHRTHVEMKPDRPPQHHTTQP